MKRSIATYLAILVLGLCLLVFPSFVATLELHHALGETDEDGHQHSAADLCSWVQSHVSFSIVGCAPVLASAPAVVVPEPSYQDHFVPHLLLTDLPARAPPSDLL